MLDLFGKEAAAAEDGTATVDATTDGRTRADLFDQYYTRRDVAALCMEHVRAHVPVDEVATWLEPSAGTGAFLTLLPTPRVGLDIDDEHSHEEAIAQDFLKWHGGGSLARPVVTVGNPPFGRNASLALAFVNHAARFSDWICMILPRTFDKATMQNKVNLHYELVASHPLDPFSFEYEGQPYDVPCCFQIWRLKPAGEKRRPHRAHMTHPDFRFVASKDDADFAFQRVGVNAGLASREGLDKSWKSNHFIKAADGVDPERLMADLNSIDWKTISSRTAGNPSIGKGEMIEAYSRISPPERVDPLGLDA